MSIVKMKRIALIGLDVKKEDLINRLMDFGLVELTDQNPKMQEEIWANSTSFEDNQEQISIFENRINQSQLALDIIEKYAELKQPFFKTRRRISGMKFTEIAESHEKAWDHVEFILGIQDEIAKENDKINRIDQEITALTPWKDYDVPLEDMETGRTKQIIGILPNTADTDEVIKRLEDEVGSVLPRIVSWDKDMFYMAITTLKTDEDDVISILKSYGFNNMAFDKTVGTVQENIVDLTEKREKEAEKLEGLKNKVKEYANLKEPIEEFQDYQQVELDKLKVRDMLLNTKKTFFVEGWVPAKSEDKLKALLDEEECYYEMRDPLEDENPPVLLKNSSFFTPVESITEMYSLPDYRGFDPTSIYALFYICFFGMMFSDAGYGLILGIGCFVILKKFDLEGNMYRMIKMFMYCGVSTLFWGIMFGGFFGDLISAFSSTFFGKEWAFPTVWFNPLDDPMKLLVFSLVLGVIHLFIGMGINAYMEIRDGHVVDAIFNEGAWYVTIPGLAMLLAGGMVGIPALTPIGKWMSIVGVVMLIIGGARGKKGFGMITGAFSNVYSITSWLSDILSYARLLALGLATGVIAQVVNVMGTLFGGGVQGFVLFILIFVVGTAINFAINVLGSFIHAARLQYVEFFGKFYKDGGDPFKPFMKNTKYVRIEDEK